MSRFYDEMPLHAARDLVGALRETQEGVTCPCCAQRAKVYPRPLNAGQAKALIEMYRVGRREWLFVPDLKLPGGDLLKLRFWGLIEQKPGLVREDGSNRVGWWRVTELGERWVGLKAVVPRRCRIYANESLGPIGESVSIKQVLGKKFDYTDLMWGT